MKLVAAAGMEHALVSYYLQQRQRRGEPVADAAAQIAFLTETQVRTLLAAPDAVGGMPAWPELPGGPRDLWVVVDYRSFAPFCGIAGFHQRLALALQATRAEPPALRLVVLGNGCAETPPGDDADGGGLSPLDATIAEAADVLFEVRRRADDHFQRHPLSLPACDASGIHALPAEAVAGFLAERAAALAPGVHLLHAAALCSQGLLLQAVAAEAQIPTREAVPSRPADAVAELMVQGVQHACQRYQFGDEAVRVAAAEAALQLHELAVPGIDWRGRVGAIVQARRARPQNGAAVRWADVPGAQRLLAAGGTRYLRCGAGPVAVLLVNAFGLTPDFWGALAGSLSRRCTVLALDDDESLTLPRTYYSTPDSLQRFVAGLHAVLDAQGLSSCHVVSWCSGAKFAIELARALPRRVESLSLLAPSFAGAQGCAGSDSPFESSLHTMCKLVERLPQSAASMAQSMMALLTKGGGQAAAEADPSGAAVFELADAAQLPWLHQPFASAACMVEYSRQVTHFRDHQLSPPPDGQRPAQPVLLVTGQMDTATSALRARDICARLCNVVQQVELRAASHYFIGQNHGLVAQLLGDFVYGRLPAAALHPRFSRIAAAAEETLVSGEI